MVTDAHESKSSVELGRNSAGDTAVTVKVYRDPGDEDEAMAEAIARYDALCTRYPLSLSQDAKRAKG